MAIGGSTAAGINASSPTKILLTAGGAGITISGGNITLAAPGNITLKAGMKNFAGGASKDASLTLIDPQALVLGPKATTDVQFRFVDDDGEPQKNMPYVLIKDDGSTLEGKTDGDGKTALYKSTAPEKCAARLLNEMEG